jgi:hypothetical protein
MPVLACWRGTSAKDTTAISASRVFLLGLGAFEGNVWADEGKIRMGLFIDERANEEQRQALQTIFGGHVGGWPAIFATKIGELRGVEFVPIEFEVAEDLAFWRAEIPGRVSGRANALSGPTTPAGKRVQTLTLRLSAVRGKETTLVTGLVRDLREENFLHQGR